MSRVVEWTEEGIRYKPDQTHAEIIAWDLGLDCHTNGTVTNMLGKSEKEEEGDEGDLKGEDATRYRALMARGIYLAQDRTDIQFAVTELGRDMSCPSGKGWRRLKRLGRYLVDKGRYDTWCRYEAWAGKITVWTETGYAGCGRSRK